MPSPRPENTITIDGVGEVSETMYQRITNASTIYMSSDMETPTRRRDIQYYCVSCDDRIDINTEDGFRFHSDGRLFCDECYRDSFMQCALCSEICYAPDLIELSFTVDRQVRNVCSPCMGRAAGGRPIHQCSSCHIYFLYDDQRYLHGNNGRCINCVEEYGSDDIRIHAWEESPDFIENAVPGKIVTSVRPFGVELEVEYTNKKSAVKGTSELPQCVGVGTDGSIQGNGLEIRLPPVAGSKGEAIVKDTCTALTKNKFKVNPSCGFHVHIDMKDVDDLEATRQLNAVKNLWMMHVAFEDVIMSFLSPSRRANRYCKVLRSEYSIEEIANAKNMNDLEMLWYRVKSISRVNEAKSDHYGLQTRYRGINLHPFFSDRHMEVRYHTGTINPTKILEWVNLHCQMVDYACRGNEWDIGTIKTHCNNFDLTEKTRELFKWIQLPESSKGYFLARQRMFMAKDQTEVETESFKSGMKILQEEKEI